MLGCGVILVCCCAGQRFGRPKVPQGRLADGLTPSLAAPQPIHSRHSGCPCCSNPLRAPACPPLTLTARRPSAVHAPPAPPGRAPALVQTPDARQKPATENSYGTPHQPPRHRKHLPRWKKSDPLHQRPYGSPWSQTMKTIELNLPARLSPSSVGKSGPLPGPPPHFFVIFGLFRLQLARTGVAL